MMRALLARASRSASSQVVPCPRTAHTLPCAQHTAQAHWDQLPRDTLCRQIHVRNLISVYLARSFITNLCMHTDGYSKRTRAHTRAYTRIHARARTQTHETGSAEARLRATARMPQMDVSSDYSWNDDNSDRCVCACVCVHVCVCMCVFVCMCVCLCMI